MTTRDDLDYAAEVEAMVEKSLTEYVAPRGMLVYFTPETLKAIFKVVDQRRAESEHLELDRSVRIFAPGYDYPAEELRQGNVVPRTPKFMIGRG
jgi:hypothetical protein